MIWLDAHLSPALAIWLTEEFGQPAAHLRQLGLRHAKDADFVDMVRRLGPPPAILWLTCGNTSNLALRALLGATLPRALALIESGETLVEITDPR